MKNRTIKLIVALATVSILGIIITQVYWMRKAFDMEELQFNQTVYIALQTVADKMAEVNQVQPKSNPVKQIYSNYFVVNLNDAIDANILEHYLKLEFAKRHLYIDFEYAIYDCSSDKMVYGNYVSYARGRLNKKPENLPKWSDYVYYFGVRFPTKTTFLATRMDIWIFSSLILGIVVIFFGYTLFVIFKQKRLSEIQRDFINNMTHEFKTPISTIAVSADLIINPKIKDKPESIQNYAQIIKEQNNRLKNQIEKVLQMAVMDKGKLILNKEKFSLHLLLRDTVKNFNLKTENEIDLQCDLEASRDLIEADQVHLTNIIYNLLDNAIKYVEQRPEIRIRTFIEKNILHLSIKDNGIGISKEHQKKIFDRFYRVPTGNIHNVKGFGLGLHYVKNVVLAHGWKIKVHSELNVGSAFTILIPLISEKNKEVRMKETATV